MKEDLNKLKDIPCQWIRRLNIVKMAILPKLMDRFNAISIKIPGASFAKIDKLIKKFIWKCKGTQTAKIILKKKN